MNDQEANQNREQAEVIQTLGLLRGSNSLMILPGDYEGHRVYLVCLTVEVQESQTEDKVTVLPLAMMEPSNEGNGDIFEKVTIDFEQAMSFLDNGSAEEVVSEPEHGAE